MDDHRHLSLKIRHSFEIDQRGKLPMGKQILHIMILGAVLTGLLGVTSAIGRECDSQCAANERRTSFISQNPELAPKVRDAILKGRVVLGMSKQEVIAAIGEPSQSVDVNASWAVREQWVYEDSDGLMFYYFKFGTVSGWHKPGVN